MCVKVPLAGKCIFDLIDYIDEREDCLQDYLDTVIPTAAKVNASSQNILSILNNFNSLLRMVNTNKNVESFSTQMSRVSTSIRVLIALIDVEISFCPPRRRIIIIIIIIIIVRYERTINYDFNKLKDLSDETFNNLGMCLKQLAPFSSMDTRTLSSIENDFVKLNADIGTCVPPNTKPNTTCLTVS